MDRNLTLDAVRLTEASALIASRYMGKGDEETAEYVAVKAMAALFPALNINAEVIVGTCGHDNLLASGAKVGDADGLPVDVAVKALDGRYTCARGGQNAISIIALGSKGAFIQVPDLKMEKIAVGRDVKSVVDINEEPEINIKRVARARGKYIEDITVCILDSRRNASLVEKIRKTGARIRYIIDGDISGMISTALDENPIDIMMGTGGAKETVLAAAALKCLGGNLQARFIPDSNEEKKLLKKMGIENPEKVLYIGDMVKCDDIIVSITGITDGVLLPGVRYFSGGAKTSSIVIREKTHTVRFINAEHLFDYKPIF